MKTSGATANCTYSYKYNRICNYSGHGLSTLLSRLAVTLSITGSTLVGVTNPATASNLPPFSCSPNFYLSQAEDLSDPSQLNDILIDLDNTPAFGLASIPAGANTNTTPYNAIGYSQADNYLYGVENDPTGTSAAHNVIRIGADGNTEVVRTIPDPGNQGRGTTPRNYVVGDVIVQGGVPYLYAATANLRIFYRVNLADPDIPAEAVTVSGNVSFLDFAFHPTNGRLYGIESDTHNQANRLVELTFSNPTTAVANTLTLDKPLPGNRFGGVFFDSNGTFYAYHNGDSGTNVNVADGNFFAIDIDTANTAYTLTPLGQAVNVNQNDGARCAAAPPPTELHPFVDTVNDYGDAPDSYGTLSANNGAHHGISPSIYLGTTAPDAETDAVSPLDGSGDDANGDDENGVTLAPLTVGDTDYTIPSGNIAATGTGTLHGWVDFDRNGTFESGEYANVAINGGTLAGNLSWSGITVAAAGDTYARFRFTSDPDINGTTPKGAAYDGEVEDYPLTIQAASTPPADTAVPTTHQCPTDQRVTWATPSATAGSTTSSFAYGLGGMVNVDLNKGYTVDGSAATLSFITDYPQVLANHQLVTNAYSLPSFNRFTSSNAPDAFSVWVGTKSQGTIEHQTSVDFTSTTPGVANGSTIVGISHTYPNVTNAYESQINVTAIRSDGSAETDYSDWAFMQDTSQNIAVTNDAKYSTPWASATVTANGLVLVPGTVDGSSFSGDDDAIFGQLLLPSDADYREIIITRKLEATGNLYGANNSFVAEDQEYFNIYIGTLNPDYGDAPASYGTLQSANGARHLAGCEVYLGANAPDGDDDGQPGDDADQDGADEDGVTLPALSAGATSYTIPANSITVTNKTSGTATLHAWVDFDGSGTFEADEYASQTVAAGTDQGNPAGNLEWSGAGVSGLTGGTDTYARFRITTDGSLGSGSAGGVAKDGEVEDYKITIPASLGKCVPGSGTADPSITPRISDEIRGNSDTTRTLVDGLDDSWRTDVGLPQTGTVEPWFGAARTLSNNESNLFTYRLDNQTISVGVALVNVDDDNNCTGSVHGGSTATLDDSNTLQDNAPRPVSLYDNSIGASNGHPAMWNETVGATNSPNGVLFTFSQPVRAFGAWFGDVETRTDGNGTPAYLRLLDASGDRIGADIAIQPNNLIESGGTTAINQANCGSTATDKGCGNQSTRWISFVDSSAAPRVKQALLIVGDDDAGDDGHTEHISFIGLNLLPASNPNVLLVKRITALNGSTTTSDGSNLAQYLDDADNPYDDNTITVADPVNPTDPPKDTEQWPNITANLLGGVSGGNVMPDDEIEYTIYFLSSGDSPAQTVVFCDYVPTFTSFIPNAYAGRSPQDPDGIGGADLSVELYRGGLTNYHTGAIDGDSAYYFGPGIDPATRFPDIDCEGDGDGVNANPNGAVVVNLGDLPNVSSDAIADGAYGHVRFRARVK